MRTKDAVSNHSTDALTTTLGVFVVIYFAVFGTGISYMIKLVGGGPEELGPDGAPTQAERGAHRRTPARPLSVAPDHADPAIGLVPSRKE